MSAVVMVQREVIVFVKEDAAQIKSKFCTFAVLTFSSFCCEAGFDRKLIVFLWLLVSLVLSVDLMFIFLGIHDTLFC